jgi:hypothetical protein
MDYSIDLDLNRYEASDDDQMNNMVLKMELLRFYLPVVISATKGRQEHFFANSI